MTEGKRSRLVTLVLTATAVLGGVAAVIANIQKISDSVANLFADDPIQLIVSLALEPVDYTDQALGPESQYQVTYAESSAGSAEGTSIQAQSDFNNPLLKTVGILGSGPYFALPKVGLDVKIVNNSKETIFLSAAVLEVASSEKDDQPLLALTHSIALVDEIEFTNDGWGEPNEVTMLARIKGDTADMIELPYTVVPVTEFYQTGEGYHFDIIPLLEAQGLPGQKIRDALRADNDEYALVNVEGEFDVQAFDQYEEARTARWQEISPYCIDNLAPFADQSLDSDLERIAAYESSSDTEVLGEEEFYEEEFQADEDPIVWPWDCTVVVEGTLNYSWNDPKGAPKSRSSQFAVEVSVTPPDGLGAPAFEPTGSYDLELQASGTSYSVRKAISQPVSSGDFDRFTLWLGAPQSSDHTFTLQLEYNNSGKIVSQPIHFSYLKPRSTLELEFPE